MIQASGIPQEVLTNKTLIEENSLAPIETVRVQKALNQPPSLLSVPELTKLFAQHKLEPIAIPKRNTNPPVIEITGVSFRYKEQQAVALENINLEIRQGEFAGIIGRNGSGKSTLLRHLNGLQMPQQGQFVFLEKMFEFGTVRNFRGEWDLYFKILIIKFSNLLFGGRSNSDLDSSGLVSKKLHKQQIERSRQWIFQSA